MMRQVLNKLLGITQRTRKPLRVLSVSDGFPTNAVENSEGDRVLEPLPLKVASRVHHAGVAYVEASWSNSTPVHLTTIFPPSGADDTVKAAIEPGVPSNCSIHLDGQNHAVIPAGMTVEKDYNPKRQRG